MGVEIDLLGTKEMSVGWTDGQRDRGLEETIPRKKKVV